MQKSPEKIVLLAALLILLGVGGYYTYLLRFTAPQKAVTAIKCTPAFADGDGPYYKAGVPFRDTLYPNDYTGANLVITGKVYKKDCVTPVPNAELDIWHADDSGVYQDDWYRGRIKTNEKGEYQFTTLKPKGYGEGTAFRPPHIHFKVWVENYLIVTSEMFFPESKGQPGFDDAFILKIVDESSPKRGHFRGYHDIYLP